MATFHRSYRTSGTRRSMTGTRRSGTTGSTFNPRKFITARKEVVARIGSYQALSNQWSGISNVTGFSPTTANRWIRFVSNGSRIYSFSSGQFSRLFGSEWNHSSPTTAYRFLRRKYGAGIKAVTRGRNNTWLIAASPNISARPFSNYNWK